MSAVSAKERFSEYSTIALIRIDLISRTYPFTSSCSAEISGARSPASDLTKSQHFCAEGPRTSTYSSTCNNTHTHVKPRRRKQRKVRDRKGQKGNDNLRLSRRDYRIIVVVVVAIVVIVATLYIDALPSTYRAYLCVTGVRGTLCAEV